MPYAHTKTITIDHTKVTGGADLTNFPMLFQGTYAGSGSDPDLRGTGSGGQVQNSSGYDIIFTSDSGGSTLLDWEIDSYDPTTGAVCFWVKIPTLSHTTDTVIYLWWGNASISTFQGNVNGTWNSSYKAVYHFAGSGSLTSVSDSTSNGNTLSTVGGFPGIAAGQFGVAGNFAGQYIYSASPTGLPTAAPLSLECWFKEGSTGLTQVMCGFGDNTGSGTSRVLNWIFQSSGAQIGEQGARQAYTEDTTTWHHLVVTYPSGAATTADELVYIDGVPVSSYIYGGWSLTYSSSPHMVIGTLPGAEGTDSFHGLVDEVRVTNTQLTAGWVATEFANYNSPSSFYSLAGGGGGGGGLLINPGMSGGMRPQLNGGMNG